MQALDGGEMMSAPFSVQHMANQRGLPFFLIGAGLPNLATVLSSARSYAERLFTYATIGPLSPTTPPTPWPSRRNGSAPTTAPRGPLARLV